MSISILIPAYKPDEKLVTYVESLISYGFKDIIVINDGSGEEYSKFYSAVDKYDECTVLVHEVNRGKGRGIKTGLQYILENRPECKVIVTGDADGQHTLKDTAAVGQMTLENPDSLVLGVRDFTLDSVPPRSRFGNRTTSFVFKLMYGKSVSDTQTGLRGIPVALAPLFIATEGDRYEFEMNMLIMCADRNIPILEQPISTVYIDDNASSHFRPVADSVRIYWLIFRSLIMYMVSGTTSYIFDIGIFWLLSTILLPAMLPNLSLETGLLAAFGATAIATTVARVLSSVVNFYMNKLLVFKKSGESVKSTAKYIIVAVGAMLLTIVLVWAIHSFLLPFINVTYVKMIVDFMLMLVNYYLQRVWVFKKKRDEI